MCSGAERLNNEHVMNKVSKKVQEIVISKNMRLY